ncbi:MAG TPA: ADP-ribosylglycohydrolase [Planctomycetes bacterium]|nr:ADP-ribosylglycohydrolase [Planctomycetota bacterium]
MAGALLGTAVGDALGLPREGLSPRRAERLFGSELRHAFFFGRGFVSDDTEHTCMVAQALLAASDPTTPTPNPDPDRFARSLGWRLRGWLLGLPAGIGFATLRALLKLCLGFPPTRSGVYSAGNGPAMRAAVLGAALGDDPELLAAHVRAATRITHTDPRAYEGALIVALAAHHAATHAGQLPGPTPTAGATAFLDTLLSHHVHTPELRDALTTVADVLTTTNDPADLATRLNLERGVTGYVVHSVPAALFCWLRSPHDFRAALTAIVRMGGDADTTGAILGGIAGAGVGPAGIPAEWRDPIADFPRTLAWIERLAARLSLPATDPNRRPLPLFWPLIPVRNLFFLAVVLCHGFRRLLPPY